MKPTLFFSVTVLAFASFALCSTSSLRAQNAAKESATIADKVSRTRISGVDVIAYQTGVKDVVTFRGSLPAGDSFAPETNVAIPTLVGGMLDKGTTRQDKFAIAQQLESVGARLSFEVHEMMLTFSGKCLRKDLPLVISLLAEQLRSPAFSSDEFDKLKRQLAGNLRRMMESTDYRANEAFVRAVYSVDHPNHAPSTEEFLKDVEAATLNDLKSFYSSFYGPAQMTLVAVGDLDVRTLQAEVQKAFQGWSGGKTIPKFAKSTTTDGKKEQSVYLADKTSVSIVMGQASGLRYSDNDALALRVANAIFGRGFTGRLMSTVRDTEGLTYGIGSSLGNDAFTDGDFRIFAQFNPELLEKGLTSTRRELNLWYTKGVTAQELERSKNDLIGSYKVGLATTEGLAESILLTVHRGYGVDWLDQYPQRIQALTLEQVNGAITRHLNPAKMITVKAGTLPDAKP